MGGARPEASLQLALDVPALKASLALVAALRPRLARVEVGTPLLVHSGLAAVGIVRSVLLGDVVVVADTKICDAGKRMATDAFGAGADAVTVVGAALDETTWQAVLDAAGAVPAGPGTVIIDTLGWQAPQAGPALRTLCQVAGDAGVP